MAEFVIGFVLGGRAIFYMFEVRKAKVNVSRPKSTMQNPKDNIQWQNLLNYDGSERGQISIEN